MTESQEPLGAVEIVSGKGFNKDTPCLVCGEAVGPAPVGCPTCETPHHFDCWEYNDGCAVYACQIKAKPREPVEARPELPGKLGLPQKRAGSYAGHLWAPPVATVSVFVSEALAIILFWVGNFAAGSLFTAWMLLSLLWIALSAENYYIDFETRKVTKVKVLGGFEIWEWEVTSLSELTQLSLSPCDFEGPNHTPSYRILGHFRQSGSHPLCLTPPMQAGSEGLRESIDLMVRIYASQAFPVRIPKQLQPRGLQSFSGNLKALPKSSKDSS